MDFASHETSAQAAARRAGLLPVAALAAGCNLLGGIEEKELVADTPASSAVTGGGGVGTGGSGGVGGEASAGSGGCSADLTSDPANCGACGHDCLGGACDLGRCQPVVLVEAAHPIGVAVDATHVYFAERNGPRLQRVLKGGGDPEVMYTVDAATSCAPTVVALDDTHVFTTVYAYEASASWVARVSKQGGAATILADGLIGSWPLLVDGNRVLVGNRWDARYLVSIDKTTGALQTMGTSMLACCHDDPLGTVCCEDVVDLAVDGDHAYLAGAQKLRRISLDGGPSEVVGGSEQAAIAVEVDETHVYWTGEGHVWRTPKDAPRTRESLAPLSMPSGMAIDDTHVYYAHSGGVDLPKGELRRVRKNGSRVVEVLASGLRGVSEIALDDSAVYVTVQFDGVVLKVAK